MSAADATYVSGSSAVTPNSSEAIQRERDPADASPMRDAGAVQNQAFTDEEPLEHCGLRAQRKSNADLAPALCHRVGKHAVDPHNRERQRHRSRDAQQHQSERGARDGASIDFVQGPHLGQWQTGVHGVNRGRDVPQECFRARTLASNRKRYAAANHRGAARRGRAAPRPHANRPSAAPDGSHRLRKHSPLRPRPRSRERLCRRESACRARCRAHPNSREPCSRIRALRGADRIHPPR